MSDPCALSAGALAAEIAAGRLSAREAVEASLRRSEAVQARLNPFALVLGEEALEAARAADDAQVWGEPVGALHGVPVAFKDFTPTRGHRTTRGSACLADWVPDHDPVIVRRLRAAGAILVGKTTTPEFAHSSFCRSPLFGHTHNPWARDRTSGGSSGGSAVAATTGCVALAEGTDMGGSVRIPAACCGCVGLKPSLGRIPMDILPTSFDDMSHFGPLARTVEDAALFLRVAEGPDLADISSQSAPRPLPPRLDPDPRGLRVALSPDLGVFAVNDEVAANLAAVASALAGAGAEVEPVSLPWTPALIEAWTEWWGVYLAAAFGDLLPEWRDRMDPEVVALLEAGLAADAVAFKRVETARTEAWRALARVFRRFDALLTPTVAVPAPPVEGSDADWTSLDANGRLKGFEMTSPFNMMGQCPALSVPSGRTRDGLPTAAQIVARPFDDATALRLGAAVEALRPWPAWRPDALGPGADPA